MALANVSLNDTFLTWLTRFNQGLVINNLVTEGQLNTSGTIKITNPSLLNGGVSLNVANGMISGDGGLISNLRSEQLSSNSINLTSNSATLTISRTNNGRLGSTIFFDIGTLSTSVNDTSIANIASANSVNTAHGAAVLALNIANTANAGLANAGGGFYRGNNGDRGAIGNKQDIFRVHLANVTSNIFFSDLERASAVGPLYIDAGQTLTINTGARLVIL